MNSIRKVVKFAYSRPYRREKITAAPFKGFCKKLRASNILMQENYMSELSNIFSAKQFIDGIEMRLRGVAQFQVV
jgi:hypothetical protein